ncbi:MAG: flagellar filament capping protein FliD [Bacillota bacterium]
MAGISVSGLGSGINWSQVIDQLMALERRSVDALQKKKTQLNAAKTAWESLLTKLGKLGEKASLLSQPSAYQAKKVTNPSEDVLKVSASTSAQTGTYQVRVETIAKAHQVASGRFADPAQPLNLSGSFRINSMEVQVTAEDSIQTLWSKMNQIKDSPFTVQIIDNRLVFTMSRTGADNRLVFEDDPETRVLVELGILQTDGSLSNEIRQAQDARLWINGLEVTRDSNVLSDVVPGLTFTLLNANNLETTITVSADHDHTISRLREFIDAYNDTLSWVGTNLGTGSLSGDSVLRRIEMNLRAMASFVLGDEASPFRVLRDVGLSTIDKKGLLQLDDAALRKALETDAAGVQRFFSADDSVKGFVPRVQEVLSMLTDTYHGVIVSREKGLKLRIEDIEKQADRMNQRLSMRESRMVREFTALEKTLSVMNAQSTWLAGQLVSLNNLYGGGRR